MTDPYVGRLTFIRIYSGTLTKGMNLINSTKDTKERISRLLEMHANKREERDEFYAGDIAACIGLKKRRTGIPSALLISLFFLRKWNFLSL